MFGIIHANAQTDTLALLNVDRQQSTQASESIITNRYLNLKYSHHSFCVALPVAVTGLALLPADNYVCERVQKGIPHFKCVIDDYLQYTPWASDAIFKDKKLFKSHWNVTADYIIKNY